ACMGLLRMLLCVVTHNMHDSCRLFQSYHADFITHFMGIPQGFARYRLKRSPRRYAPRDDTPVMASEALPPLRHGERSVAISVFLYSATALHKIATSLRSSRRHARHGERSTTPATSWRAKRGHLGFSLQRHRTQEIAASLRSSRRHARHGERSTTPATSWRAKRGHLGFSLQRHRTQEIAASLRSSR
ncbi:hypothetical protein, partial [Halomonas garicola]|uniref:hypothetical protein n=1 Tax=Halomonas garicola TaxID=1690008 RepID=UPI0028969253